MKTLRVLLVACLRKIDHCFWSFITYGITSKMVSAIATGVYKANNPVIRECTWKKFRKAASGKKVVMMGLDGVSTDFVEKYQNKYEIACIYTFSGFEKIKDYKNVPVKNIEHFRTDIYGGENIYIITSSFLIEQYCEIMQKNNIDTFYSYIMMEDKKVHIKLRKPLIRLRYVYLYQLFHKDGLFTNYIVFPIKAFLRKLHTPGLYDKYSKQIKHYKGIHSGKRCFIVATGPSLTVEDVEQLKNEITFGVNGIFKLYSKTDWRPTYYCLCDPYVYIDYIKKGYVMDIDGFSKEEAFLPKYLEKTLKTNPHTKKTKLIPVCYLNHMIAEKNTKLYYSDDPVWGFYNSRTVACYCANIAQYMGFKEIYFLGTDCDYITNGQHFSDEKSPNIVTEDQLRKAQVALILAFSFLKAEMDKRGIKVYNATRGGALEVFPRRSLEEIFNKVGPA